MQRNGSNSGGGTNLGLYTKLTDRPVAPAAYTATFNKTTINRLGFQIQPFI